MVNDIIVNFGHLPTEQAAAAVANHVEKFWDLTLGTYTRVAASMGGG